MEKVRRQEAEEELEELRAVASRMQEELATVRDRGGDGSSQFSGFEQQMQQQAAERKAQVLHQHSIGDVRDSSGLVSNAGSSSSSSSSGTSGDGGSSGRGSSSSSPNNLFSSKPKPPQSTLHKSNTNIATPNTGDSYGGALARMASPKQIKQGALGRATMAAQNDGTPPKPSRVEAAAASPAAGGTGGLMQRGWGSSTGTLTAASPVAAPGGGTAAKAIPTGAAAAAISAGGKKFKVQLKPGPIGITFAPVLPEPNGVYISAVGKGSQIQGCVEVGNRLLKLGKTKVEKWTINDVTAEVRKTAKEKARTMVFLEQRLVSSGAPVNVGPASVPQVQAAPRASPSNPFA
jgi:hypothetical protein